MKENEELMEHGVQPGQDQNGGEEPLQNEGTTSAIEDNEEAKLQEENTEESGAEHVPAEEEKDLAEELAQAKQQLAEKTAEAQSLYQQFQRLQADFDNFRKRYRKEKEDLVKFAVEELISRLLPVLDNFERALSQDAGKDSAAFISGVEMIYRQLMQVLEQEGLQPIPTVGEIFDPQKHEAVMRVESDENPENTVVEELQRGFTLHGKVIRPAMVKVAIAVSDSNVESDSTAES